MNPHDLDMDELRNDLKRDEGLRLRPYRDTAGKLTIGWGRNLSDCGISRDEADYLLEQDISRVLTGVKGGLPWFDALDGVRKRVLVNLAFNVGVYALLTDWRPTLQLVSDGDWKGAAAHLLASKAAHDAPSRYARMAALMVSGEDA